MIRGRICIQPSWLCAGLQVPWAGQVSAQKETSTDFLSSSSSRRHARPATARDQPQLSQRFWSVPRHPLLLGSPHLHKRCVLPSAGGSGLGSKEQRCFANLWGLRAASPTSHRPFWTSGLPCWNNRSKGFILLTHPVQGHQAGWTKIDDFLKIKKNHIFLNWIFLLNLF